MRKVLLLLAICLCKKETIAQSPLYSQYMVNMYMLNPGVAGASGNTEFQLGYRNQWAGFEGAPETTYFSATGKFNTSPKPKYGILNQVERAFSAWGGFVYVDQYGPIRETVVNASYAYHVPLTKQLKISLGLSAGFKDYYLDQEKIVAQNQNDPLFTSYRTEKYFENIFGIWLYNNTFYTGISSSEISFSSISDYNNYFFTFGFKKDLSQNISIVPSLLFKAAPHAPLQMETSTKVRYKEDIWAGMSFRSDRSIMALLGFQINKHLDLNYSYDIPFASEVERLESPSHEFVLGYKIKKRKPLCFTYW